MLSGWANYFCLGPVSKAFSAVDCHARRRLRRWLCDKHKEPRPAYEHFWKRLFTLVERSGAGHRVRHRHGSTANRRNPLVSAEGAGPPRVAGTVRPETVKHGSLRGSGEIPRAYSATGNGTKPNRTEVPRRKPLRISTGRLQSLRRFTLNPVGEHGRQGQACYRSEECCREHDAWRGRTGAYIKAGKEEGNVGHRPSPKSKPEIHSSDLCRDFTMNFSVVGKILAITLTRTAMRCTKKRPGLVSSRGDASLTLV
jgi:hypothetical protein